MSADRLMSTLPVLRVRPPPTSPQFLSEPPSAKGASDPVPPYEDVNPYALPAPLAPEIAARDAGVDVQLGVLVSAFERLHPLADMVLVEGVGGWAAPLTATLDQRHLVEQLRLPVVLVVGMRLGCINHARLSARAIQDDGARLVQRQETRHHRAVPWPPAAAMIRASPPPRPTSPP